LRWRGFFSLKIPIKQIIVYSYLLFVRIFNTILIKKRLHLKKIVVLYVQGLKLHTKKGNKETFLKSNYKP